MQNPDLGDTQPSKLNGASKQLETPEKPEMRLKATRRTWLWLLAVILFLCAAGAGGGLAGYRSGQKAADVLRAESLALSLKEQFDLGVSDFDAGRYPIARQRFEFVFEQDPSYPGLADKMASLLTILYATATPTPVTPTPTVTLTPTRDLRPVQDRLALALEYLGTGDWTAVIESLIGLRADEPTYKVARVDGLLYLALRQNGVEKIYQHGDLQGGIYDLGLAENFGPLDLEASVARNMARLYLYGSSFWEAYPELAVEYFSQVASAMPYLRDGSGWTAVERYRGALIQLGNQLAIQEDWCAAFEQFQAAASIRPDAALNSRLEESALRCAPPTPTLEGSPTPTFTLTPTWTGLPPTATVPTTTDTPLPPTDTPPAPDTPTPEPPTETPTPTETQPAEPGNPTP